jgi:hypothetical protein
MRRELSHCCGVLVGVAQEELQQGKPPCWFGAIEMTSILTTAIAPAEGVGSRQPLKIMTAARRKLAQLDPKECEVLHAQRLEVVSSSVLPPAQHALSADL